MKLYQKILTGIVIAVGSGAAIYGVVKLLKKNKKGQKIRFVRNRSLSGLGMTGINVKIPAISQSPFKESDIPIVKDKLKEIDTNYGNIISASAKLTYVNTEIIQSFIFIESRGDKNANNDNSYGLMQINTTSATDLLHLANKQGLINDKLKEILKKHLGEKFETILKMQYNNQFGLQVTASDLKNPVVNIIIGTLYLRLLIDYFTENGTVRLDKVVVCYNMGYSYRTKLTGPEYATVESAVKNLNSITSSYIVKLLGKNGLLDILTV